ncbi:hypothetical protein SLA2020_003210 [Shorea laevis]
MDCARSCCICEQTEESPYHVFFTYHWSKQVWVGSCPFFTISSIKPEDYLDDFLNSFLKLNREQKEWVAVTLWCIWNNRNCCLFQSSSSKPDFTITWISKYIKEYPAATNMGNQIRQLE